ncbi:MAG: allantoinase AllB [Oscillospiraceae bacterium]|nr:allantoinase AllB [Oscillospiraceae bacterium]
MRFDLIVKNGTIVNTDGLCKADICVKDGKIAAIVLDSRDIEADECCDAAGKYVFPGAVDAHMHIGEYNADFEDMQTSTMAAAVGGITTCVDMPLNLYSPSVVNGEIFKAKKELLGSESYVDFIMWGALVPENLDKLVELHDAGAAAFKSFLSGGGNDFHAPDMGQVRQALMTIKEFDGLAGFHCEDYSIISRGRQYVLNNKIDGRQAFCDSRPLSAEIIATSNIIELARETGARVHICHVSHPRVAAVIERAQLEGVDITAETCSHYLTFSREDYLEKGCLFGCAPSLREKEAIDGLWEYVKKGVLGCIVSDHSPGMPESRSDEHQPTYMSGFGISSIQTVFRTVFDGAVKHGCSPCILARELSENPARRFGIYGTKGAVKTGFDADMVIVDPEREWAVKAEELYYKQKVSCFVGHSGKGEPVATYIRGVKAAENGRVLVSKGFGKFVG